MSATRLSSAVVVVNPSKYRKETAEDADRFSSRSGSEEGEEREKIVVEPPKERKKVDMTMTKAGGAYIPPAKLKLMQQQIEDKNRYGKRFSFLSV